MKKEILINSAINEVRVAITENKQLAEFFIDLPDKEKYVGNIYLGKVTKIASGINAAFIDIGLNQDAFLHFSDVDESLENNFIVDEDDEDDDFEDDNDEIIEKPLNHPLVTLRRAKPISKTNTNATFSTKGGKIQINLEPNQNVIVQVVREAYGSKGVKVSSKIGMPGRYMVLLPFDRLIGISRKISSYPERKRLRKIARKFLPKGYGCIIRTAAINKNEQELRKDWDNLMELWKEIEQKVYQNKPPFLLHQDMHLATSVVRDLFTTNVERIVIDSKKLHKEILNYIRQASPHLENKIELYKGSSPMFEEYGVDKELAKTYKNRVPLENAGDIMIEQTEAMVVVDVNSGKRTDSNQERNSLMTNLDAAKEVARQIRLRDIGGMVIIDFIDMASESNRKKLFYTMKKELSKDRAKTVVYPLTQLSLMQITRQRINQNIEEKISEICPTCKGTGRVTAKSVVINNIERWLKNFRKNSREFRIKLTVHPSIAELLTDGTISMISRLMIKYFVKVKLEQNELIKVDNFKFFSVKQQKDITNEFL